MLSGLTLYVLKVLSRYAQSLLQASNLLVPFLDHALQTLIAALIRIDLICNIGLESLKFSLSFLDELNVVLTDTLNSLLVEVTDGLILI